jgi:hypothetical protein
MGPLLRGVPGAGPGRRGPDALGPDAGGAVGEVPPAAAGRGVSGGRVPVHHAAPGSGLGRRAAGAGEGFLPHAGRGLTGGRARPDHPLASRGPPADPPGRGRGARPDRAEADERQARRFVPGGHGGGGGRRRRAGLLQPALVGGSGCGLRRLRPERPEPADARRGEGRRRAAPSALRHRQRLLRPDGPRVRQGGLRERAAPHLLPVATLRVSRHHGIAHPESGLIAGMLDLEESGRLQRRDGELRFLDLTVP